MTEMPKPPFQTFDPAAEPGAVPVRAAPPPQALPQAGPGDAEKA